LNGRHAKFVFLAQGFHFQPNTDDMNLPMIGITKHTVQNEVLINEYSMQIARTE